MRMSALALAAAAVAGGSLVASPARADVFVYRPGPVHAWRAPYNPYAYRAAFYPYAYAARAYWARPAAFGCRVHVTRAWVNGHYVSRRVRRCY